MLGDYVVITNGAAAFQAAVDTVDGAPSLAATSGYAQSAGAQLTGSDGFLYAPIAKLIDAIAPDATAAGGPLAHLRSELAAAVLTGSARFDSSGAAFDLTLTGANLTTAASGETNPIASLPGGSWLALGATDVGPKLAAVAARFASLASEIAGASGSGLSGLTGTSASGTGASPLSGTSASRQASPGCSAR